MDGEESCYERGLVIGWPNIQFERLARVGKLFFSSTCRDATKPFFLTDQTINMEIYAFIWDA
jgi:hypothetical protein